MKPRQTVALLQLPILQREAAILQGLQMLVENVTNLAEDASTLHKAGRYRGVAILDNLASEEAAKAFMLLDVVRAGWADQSVTARLLGPWFRSHLARGLYARAYAARPADLREIRGYLDLARRAQYLDGPNDVDWVFRNEIHDAREGVIYVDYVRDEYGDGQWVTPAERPEVDPGIAKNHLVPAIVELLATLHLLGLFTESGLSLLREAWITAPKLEQTTHWAVVEVLNRSVIQGLVDAGLPMPSATGSDARAAVDRWCFPLSSLDLGELEVTDEDLLASRDSWYAAQEESSDW